MSITLHRLRAFSLLELTVTLAIVLIISFLAYPSLNNYFVQSKVSDAVSSAAEIQTMVANQIADNESVTNSGNNLNTPASLGRYVSSYSVSANGVITIVTTPDAGGLSLTLTPVYDSTSEQVSWTCAVSGSSNDAYVPSKCRI
jgi:prepilin-type N-terminal cleavage/methylation domain-containing protein